MIMPDLKEIKRMYPIAALILKDEDLLERSGKSLRALDWLPVIVLVVCMIISVILIVLG